MAEKKTSLDFFLENCANMSDGKILVFDTETTRNGIMFQIAFELVQADKTANNNTNIGRNIMVKEFLFLGIKDCLLMPKVDFMRK